MIAVTISREKQPCWASKVKRMVRTIPVGCAVQGRIKEIWGKLLSVPLFLRQGTPG